jgi:uncharacterized phiE125 gp8 family phage protein
MITLKTLKRHTVIDHDRDDDLLDLYLNAAIAYCEGVVGRPINSQTFVDLRDCLTASMPVRVGASAITTITYLDLDGARQTLASTEYQLLIDGFTFAVIPEFDIVYPDVRATHGSVEITYVAGWAAPPSDVENAAYMFAANLYEFREAEITGSITTSIKNGLDSLLKKHAVPVI